MLSLFWGFRLTKWNVNVGVGELGNYSIMGFRLTKWNVNSWSRCYYC
ncbi:TPA: hypothetical protein KO245_003712 [Clostridioides difficile]|nr:hypothetical protein [Clostridioides difficile]